MAIIHPHFLKYLYNRFKNPPLSFDLEKEEILELGELCNNDNTGEKRNPSKHSKFDLGLIEKAKNSYSHNGIIGIIDVFMGDKILNQFVDSEVERKVICLKMGFKTLPSTKATIIFKGFGYNLTNEQVLAIYASYGLTHSLRNLGELYDFIEINKRVERLAYLLKKTNSTKERESVQRRYNAIRAYFLAGKGEKEKAIKNSGLKRSLFFNHLKNFNKYGVLGLIDKGQGIFRHSKVGLDNEAQMVLDKIQYPVRPELFYVKRMQYKGITIDRSLISKIFSRWEVEKFESTFISNLERLESLNEPVPLGVAEVDMDKDVARA